MKKLILLLLMITGIGFAEEHICSINNIEISTNLVKRDVLIVETKDNKFTLKDFEDAEYCYNEIREKVYNPIDLIIITGYKGGGTLAMYLVMKKPNTQAIVYDPLEYPQKIKEEISKLPKISPEGYNIDGKKDIAIINGVK